MLQVQLTEKGGMLVFCFGGSLCPDIHPLYSKIDLVSREEYKVYYLVHQLLFVSGPRTDNINNRGYYFPVTAYQLQGRGRVATYFPFLSFVGFTIVGVLLPSL